MREGAFPPPLTAGDRVPGEFDENGLDRHLVIGQPHGLKAETLTKRLEPRQIARIFRFNDAVILPEIIALSINCDDKRWFVHNESARQES
jgi:hypothetical protein